MSKLEQEFFDVKELEAKPVASQPGFTERILSHDPETGDYTRLLYFPLGSETATNHRHDFWEKVWIVAGAIFDLTLQKNFTAGICAHLCPDGRSSFPMTFMNVNACRPPGIAHGPWRWPEGCTTFEVRYVKKACHR